jgi:hypothetical protein
MVARNAAPLFNVYIELMAAGDLWGAPLKEMENLTVENSLFSLKKNKFNQMKKKIDWPT